MQLLEFIGLFAKDFVLRLAAILRTEYSPGIVVILLLLLLALAAIGMWRSLGKQVRCIHWLLIRIKDIKDPKDFTSKLGSLDSEVASIEVDKDFRNLAHAWKEYRETLIPYDAGDGTVIRNSVRPSTFFNLEDLHFGPGFFKAVPGFFVSVGLSLTFLGLISALDTMGTKMKAPLAQLPASQTAASIGQPPTVASPSGQLSSDAMATLLTVASAKFIMSLTGLACSIIFTVLLRILTERVDREINQLNSAIEQKLTFISLELIGIDQLKALREQKDHFKVIGMEMVAELGRPLREELPNAISTSISGAITPLIQNVREASTDGLGTMVQDLSKRFSTDVGMALESASQKLVDAGRGIEGIVSNLNQSSGHMGSAMEGAIERLGSSIEALKGTMTGGAKDTIEAFSKGSDSLLATMNSTLAEIARNTGEGAKALNEASEAMSRSALRICNELEDAAKRGSAAAEDNLKQASQSAGVVIQDAGKGILEAFAKASNEVGEVARKVTESSSEKLLAPLSQLGITLDKLVGSVGEAARHTQAASQGMQNGAEAANSAASNLRGSAQILSQASNPIAASVQAVEASTRALQSSTASIAESSRVSAQSVSEAIVSVTNILSGEQASIQATLKLLESCIQRIQGQGDRLDEMDEKLGTAFEAYRTEVEEAMESLEDHVRKIQEEYSPALSTLQTLVEQIEEFTPSSRRK
jgi:methyl-accepting chemotaxis protein